MHDPLSPKSICSGYIVLPLCLWPPVRWPHLPVSCCQPLVHCFDIYGNTVATLVLYPLGHLFIVVCHLFIVASRSPAHSGWPTALSCWSPCAHVVRSPVHSNHSPARSGLFPAHSCHSLSVQQDATEFDTGALHDMIACFSSRRAPEV